uniref:Uncharacterized protein n=1 Tax=Arundo donax TaxID=35708 RepID=A0A0A9GXR3_ARUDO
MAPPRWPCRRRRGDLSAAAASSWLAPRRQPPPSCSPFLPAASLPPLLASTDSCS